MDRFKSMFKKMKSLSNSGLDPYRIGKENLENPKLEVETLAAERAKICGGCELFEQEPIESLRIEDPRIPELTDKICGDCACSSPYLLRQSVKICRKW